MNDYWVDFSGSLFIRDCQNEDEAKEKFFETLLLHNQNEDNEFQYCEICNVEKYIP